MATAKFIHDGDSINYTPTSADVAAGDVTAHVGSDERCNDCAVCVSLKLADAVLSKV